MRSIKGIRIIYEDADLIVVEKAAGLLTCETRMGGEYTVESALGDYVRKGQSKSRRRVYLVQRLDRETSGVMMVAKSEDVQEYFRSNWNEITEKTYVARVAGRMESEHGVFESYLAEDPRTLKVRSVPPGKADGAKFARTAWRVLPDPLADGRVRAYDNTTLVEVKLHTGRKNQIRVHFSEAGHPVLGDPKYTAPGEKAQGGKPRRGDRLCLHALKLVFVQPRTRERMEFSTPAPDFAAPRRIAGTGPGQRSRADVHGGIRQCGCTRG